MASLEVRSAIIYATLIDAAALLPVFFMGGLSGAFFQPLALSYALAVLASMVVALTVTPALALILLPKAPLERRESPLVAVAPARLQPVLARIIRRPRWAYATVGVSLVVLGLVVLPLLGQSLFPTFKERDFLMHWSPSPAHPSRKRCGSSTRASQELRTIPGVRNCGSHIGQALLAEKSTASISARTGSASIPRSTMTRRWPRSGDWSTATPGSTAMCRPI